MCHNHCSAMVLKIAPCVVLIHRKKEIVGNVATKNPAKMFPYFIWKQSRQRVVRFFSNACILLVEQIDDVSSLYSP